MVLYGKNGAVGLMRKGQGMPARWGGQSQIGVAQVPAASQQPRRLFHIFSTHSLSPIVWDANSMNRRPDKTMIALTRVELIVLLGILAVLLVVAGLLLPLLARARMEGRKSVCKENLKTIGQAITAYRENNIDYFPFSWGPADMPEPRRKDAHPSLGCLHLGYLPDANVFRCPSTEDEPRFQVHVGTSRTDTEHRQYNVNWVLLDSSYGYDCRVHRRISGDNPILADMDGTYIMCSDTITQNHEEGQNVLVADGSVRWIVDSCTFGPGREDIYAEDAWNADTDAFISDNTFGGMDRSPAGYDDLGPSYDPYPLLHPKAQPVRGEGEGLRPRNAQ